MIIYKITNKINGKSYIGQTKKSLDERIQQHKKNSKKLNTHLYNAVRKYGWDNFQYDVIQECSSKEELNKQEVYWISYFDSYNNGYNSTLGGDSNPMDCEKSSKSHDEKMRSEEVRKKISESMKEYIKNNPFSEEHRKKISQSMIGNSNLGGDHRTRCIPCYCYDELGEKHSFDSIKTATVWWFDNYKPFGDKYVLITLQRKIVKSIVTEEKQGNMQWYSDVYFEK